MKDWLLFLAVIALFAGTTYAEYRMHNREAEDAGNDDGDLTMDDVFGEFA